MEYEVLYSRRKTVSVSVKNGTVIVKAPVGYGRKNIEELLVRHNKWIDERLNKDKEQMKLEESLTPQKEATLRAEAKRYFNDRLSCFSEIMGLKYGRVTITGAKTRFGSCSSKGNISFSFRLMLYPEKAREYVVVHELAHLVEMNHSKRFYAVVQKFMPDYKERRKLLKEQPTIA